MEFHRASLETCANARGVVVVIDVLRAFSTSAYAFAAGVQDITLVSTVEEAFDLQGKIPQILLMGEMNGLPIGGFDFGNSPTQFDGLDLSGKHLIQRTSAGTPGVVRSRKAEILITASFCTAGATARHIETRLPEEVTFVITGLRLGGWGAEDEACADYLEELLQGNAPKPEPFLDRVRQSRTGLMFQDSSKPELPFEDLQYCLDIDRFDFTMPVRRENHRTVMIADPS
jgi:2-phosphosulfolactate phosphatase